MRLRPRNKGFALLLVIVISVTLVAIAIPFALSMRLQERGAQAGNDRTHARFAATAVRNRAVAGALRGHESLEDRRNAPAPFRTPYSDGAEEFPRAILERDPATGVCASAICLDEQGKINTLSAPESCVVNLTKRVDARTSDLRDFLTETSGRPTGWSWAQTIRNTGPGPSGTELVFVDDASRYGLGSKVRISNPDGEVGYGVVAVTGEWGSGFGVEGAEFKAVVDATIEVEVRHAVNLNTASKEVLAAVVEGLATPYTKGRLGIPRGTADLVGAALAKRTYKEWKDFSEALRELVTLHVIDDDIVSAIMLNAAHPNDAALSGTGTVPFCLNSANYFTISAHGLQDLATGAMGSVVDLREIVEAAPAGTLTWRLRSQADYKGMIGLGLANGMTTGPRLPGEAPSLDRNLSAWVVPLSAEDHRGSWFVASHFDGMNDGKALDGGLDFTMRNILSIESGERYWDGGAIELWFRASNSSFVIVDAGNETWSNRVLISYEHGGPASSGPYLKMSVKDASLEKGWSEICAPVDLTPGKWYHIGGYWHNTRSSGLMLTLDGMPIGNYVVLTKKDEIRSGRIPADLDASSASIAMEQSCEGFPLSGAFQIGSEVIEYDSRSGTTFTGCHRGARGTKAAAHPRGSALVIWGYTTLFDDLAWLKYTIPTVEMPTIRWEKLRKGNGSLVHGFGSFADTVTVVESAVVPAPPKHGMKKGDTTLKVPAGATAGFPDQGWLFIGIVDPELVHYSSKTTDSFEGLKRGEFDSVARDHFVAEPVSLYGFHVDSNEDYESPTLLCIEGEIFGPVQKAGSDGWIGLIGKTGDVVVPLPLLRDTVWLENYKARDHGAGAKVLPTFALKDLDAGPGDLVTTIKEDGVTREEHVVAATVWLQTGAAKPLGLISPNSEVSHAFQVAAFEDFMKDEINPRGGFYGRILKFPSGELPSVNLDVIHIGKTELEEAPEEMQGFIDELRLDGVEEDYDCNLVLPLRDDGGEVILANIHALNLTGGTVRIDDELIGYESYDDVGKKLVGVVRGYLGTRPRGHAAGSMVVKMHFLIVSAVQSSIEEQSRQFRIVDPGFPSEGYFLVDQEVIGWTNRTTVDLSNPAGANLRGAFGTDVTSHRSGSLAYAIPFRYHDRYLPGQEDSRLHYFGGTFRATGAIWKTLQFDDICPPGIDLHLWVRFNHDPRWTLLGQPRKKGATPIFDFSLSKPNSLGSVTADQVEFRAGWDYLPGAWKSGDWKETAILRHVDVEYEQPTVVHRHHER